MVIVTVSSGLSTGERVDFSQRARCRCLKHVGITEHRAGQWLMTLGRFHGVGRECLVDTRLVPAEGVENRLRQMKGAPEGEETSITGTGISVQQ